MTAFAVFIQGRVTDAEALHRYRALTPAARDAHPLEPLAFYGPHEVLAGDPVSSGRQSGSPIAERSLD